MGWFSRRKRSSQSTSERRQSTDALTEWLLAHRGVEAYVEPKTAFTENTVVLIAHDGEFIRRRTPSPEAAKQFARKHSIPIYDATVVGYPQRMRDFSRKQTILRQRQERGEAVGD